MKIEIDLKSKEQGGEISPKEEKNKLEGEKRDLSKGLTFLRQRLIHPEAEFRKSSLTKEQRDTLLAETLSLDTEIKKTEARIKEISKRIKELGSGGFLKGAKNVGKRGVESVERGLRGVKSLGRKGVDAAKRSLDMMGEGHARSMNPERGQPYTDIDTSKEKTDAERTKLGKTIAARLSAEREEDRLKAEAKIREALEEEAIQEDARRFKESDHEEAIQDDKDWEEAQANATEGKTGAERTKLGKTKAGVPEKELSPEEKKEIKKELDALPEKEKVEVAVGLNNIGFKVEQKKNEFFANTLGWFVKTSLNKGNTVNRFFSKLQASFTRDAKAAEQKAEDAASGKKARKLTNVGSLVGNIAKYGRIISDFTTHSMASPLRYVMMVGAFGTRMADAAKEARLDNEEVKEKTRIKDREKAAEEAWTIYTNATKEGKDQQASAEELKQAYLKRIPQDLMDRLYRDKKSGAATSVIQDFIKADLQEAVERLNTKILRIEADKKLNPEQIENKIQMLLREQERNLLDYDRILTQYGTVDELAMAARYAKAAGNAVVWATTVETIALSVEKLWGNLANMLSHEDGPKAGAAITKIIEHKDSTSTPTDTSHVVRPDSTVNADTTHVAKPDSMKTDSLGTKVPGDTTAIKMGAETGGDSLKISPDSTKISPDSGKIVGDTTRVVGADTTTAGAVGAGGKSVEAVTKATQEATTTVEKIHSGFSLDKPTEFEVKGPAQLEHAYEKLLLSRHLPEKLPEGTVLDKVLAARTLNEAANLVRLTEGHGAAGITAADFAKVAEFKNGVLHIIDPKGFNEVMDKLHIHSQDLVEKGIFSDPDSATGYIKRVNWVDKVEGNGMHGTVEHPGITGHPEVDAKQIEDFSQIPDPHEHAVTSATRKVSSIYEDLQKRIPEEIKLSVTDKLENPKSMNWIDRVDTTPANPTPMGEPLDPLRDVYNDYSRIWTRNDVDYVFNDNIRHLYPPPSGFDLFYGNSWILVKNSLATEVLNTPAENSDEVLGPVISYLHRLQEVTGLKPHGANWFRSGETVAKYIMRATQKAAEMGTEAMQKIRVR